MKISNPLEINKKLVNFKSGSSLFVVPKFWLQANNYSLTEEITITPIQSFLLITKKGDPIKKKILKLLKKAGFL